MQHRVHHGPHTRPQHRPESYPRHVRVERDHSGVEENEVIDEEPNGKIDFSKATPQKDGSLCVTKIKYMEKLEKTQVGEKSLQHKWEARKIFNDLNTNFRNPFNCSIT